MGSVSDWLERARKNWRLAKTPNFCPKCGGRNLKLFVESPFADDRGEGRIDGQAEHECLDCKTTFWL